MTLRLLTLALVLFFLPTATAAEDALHFTTETFKSLIKDLQQELESEKIAEQKNRDQVYDVIGGLKMCLPVIESVIDHRRKTTLIEKEVPKTSPIPQPVAKNPAEISQQQASELPIEGTKKPLKEEPKNVVTPLKPVELPPSETPTVPKGSEKQMIQIHTINRTVEEFKVIKDELISQLNEGKILGEDREAAYTMVGTLNLCLPIAKGAALLIEEMEKEKTAPHQPLASPSQEEINKN